jgi:succinoglycan biosynthesis transport protein ExoP
MAQSRNDMDLDDGFGFDNDESDSGEEFDLQHYLRIIRKFKFPIVFFTAMITGLASYYAYTATPIYSATSTLLIESQANSPISFEQLVGVQTENLEYYQTQYEILGSRGLAQRVVNRLNLWDHPEFTGIITQLATDQQDSQLAPISNAQPQRTGLSGALDSARELFTGQPQLTENTQALVVDNTPSVTIDLENSTVSSSAAIDSSAYFSDLDASSLGGKKLTASQQWVLGSFMERLTITPLRKTKLVNISFESPDPIMATVVANAVGEEYINSYLDAQAELTTRASLWLNKRLTELKQTLDESEDRLVGFKKDNGLIDVGGSVGRLNEQELLFVTAELAQARSELSSKEALVREVQSFRGDAVQLGSLPAFQADPLVQGVKIDQGRAQRTLDELRNRYGERHPRVVDALSQLASLDATLEEHVARVVGSVSKDYQLSQQRVAAIQAKLNIGKNEIQDIGAKTFELEALEREVQTNRTIFDTFFSRITEAKSADGLESANARISDYAVAPQYPVKPKKHLIIALAALASLVLSILMAFLYEQMDETVKSTHDVEGRLGMKLLGILPLVKGGMFGKSKSLPLNPSDIPDKNNSFGESVNTIRTAICLADGEIPRKVIVITSSIPGEGKSTVAINMAHSLAQLERVLLIDADMRRPTVAKSTGFDKNVLGLSNLITQTATAKQCIIRGVFDGAFDILPSGKIPEQPLELLSSKRFEKILEQLGHYYDRIIIDSAPTQAVSDALVLSKVSDAVIYVVKSHETSIELVKRGLERLKQVKAPLAGVIISQVDIDKIVAYGGDYYYQGYYDYYGYHEKDVKGGNGKQGASTGKLRLTQEELMEIRTDHSEVELDLDYGAEASIKRKAPRAKMQNNEIQAEDFDSTSRISMAAATRTANHASAPRRKLDDLDIL